MHTCILINSNCDEAMLFLLFLSDLVREIMLRSEKGHNSNHLANGSDHTSDQRVDWLSSIQMMEIKCKNKNG